MADLSDKGSESEGMMSKSPSPDRGSSSSSSDGNGQLRTCADCGTTKTPLWRGGPAGPKSLCNACGIRSRKKRRALLGLNKDDKKPKKTTTATAASGGSSAIATTATATAATTIISPTQSNGTKNDRNELGDSLKRKLMAIGREVVMQRPRSNLTKQKRKLGEEEQAAMLLMALSCGSVYA